MPIPIEGLIDVRAIDKQGSMVPLEGVWLVNSARVNVSIHGSDFGSPQSATLDLTFAGKAAPPAPALPEPEAGLSLKLERLRAWAESQEATWGPQETNYQIGRYTAAVAVLAILDGKEG